MTNIIHVLKSTPKGIADWPEKLTSAEDIQMFDDIVASLTLKDASNASRIS
jgi:hypothetical protein